MSNFLRIHRLATLRLPAGIRLLALVVLALASCGSDSPTEAKIEDFPSLLLGTWEEVGGTVGTLTFTGTDFSGIGRLSADGIQAETFTFLWSAPAIIRTNLNNDQEFSVLFEDGGDTLVLATVSAGTENEIIRYRRVK